MFNLFRAQPLLADEISHWLFEGYAWAIRNLGADFFRRESILVTPSNEHFPGRVNSLEGMAEAVFERVQLYAGMQNWPLRPVPYTTLESCLPVSGINIANALRGPSCNVSITGQSDTLHVAYDPQQARQPDRLIALFARELGGHLTRASHEPPPGGEEYLEHAADLAAIFLGFGIFLSNNAFNMGGGSCSGCGKSPQALGHLMEDEMVYALAIFCALKGIPDTKALPHLKAKLRPLFKKASKEVAAKGEQMNRLTALMQPQS